MASTVTISVVATSRVVTPFSLIAARARATATAVETAFRRAGTRSGSAIRSVASTAGRVFSAIGTGVTRVGSMLGTALSRGAEMLGDAVLKVKDSIVPLIATKGPLVALGVAAAGAVGNLTGVIATLPVAIAAGAASLAVFKLGLKGVNEAIEAGLSGNVDDFRKALKGLHPEAQKFVSVAVDVAKHWRNIQKAVQGKLFEGTANALGKLNAAIYPLAMKWLPQIASLFSKAGKSVAEFFTSADGSNALDKILEGAHRALEGFLGALPFLVQAFTDIGEVGAGLFGDLGQGFKGMAERFAGWIRKLKEDGTLKEWVDKAKTALETLGKIADNVGRVIMSVFKNGSDEGQGFLDNLEKSSQKWAEFMESSDGKKLVDSLGSIGEAMGHLFGLITFLSQVWLGWVEVYKDGVEFFKRGWDQMMEYAVRAVGVILEALVALLGWIPGIGDKIKQTQKDFEAWRNSSKNSLDGVSGAVNGVSNSLQSVSRNAISARDAINSIQGKTVYVNVIQRVTKAAELSGTYSSGIGGRASGGVATGMKWVGERGPELVDFGAAGGTVKNAGQSAEMMRNGGGSGGVVEVQLVSGPVTGDPYLESVKKSINNGRLNLQVVGGSKVRAV